jgi:hypothetical protein
MLPPASSKEKFFDTDPKNAVEALKAALYFLLCKFDGLRP